MGNIKLLLSVAENLQALADSVQAVADAMRQNEAPAENTVPVKAETTEPAEEPLKLEQVRAVLAEKSHEGKTEEVRNLLSKYGASKLSAVDPKNYRALLADAEVM